MEVLGVSLGPTVDLGRADGFVYSTRMARTPNFVYSARLAPATREEQTTDQ